MLFKHVWGVGIGFVLLAGACAPPPAAVPASTEPAAAEVTATPAPEAEIPTPEPAAEPAATESAMAEAAQTLTVETLANLEYQVEYTESETAQLVDGIYEDEPHRILISWIDTYALGEIDGQEAAAVVLISQTGGSGSFGDLFLVVNQEGTPVNVATAFLGDRLTYNSIAIEDNAIVLDFVVQGPDDPMCCATQRTAVTYALQDGQLVETSSEVMGTQEQVNETVVTTFVPETAPETRQAGSCFGSAIGLGRTDAWRCMVENQIYDPCFQVDDAPTVICGANPVTGETGFVLELTEPLPAPDAGQLQRAWLIELENGTVCGLLTGTIPGVGDQVAPYGCLDMSYLMEEIRRDAPVWFAQKVVFDLGEEGFVIRSSVRTPVAQVWE